MHLGRPVADRWPDSLIFPKKNIIISPCQCEMLNGNANASLVPGGLTSTTLVQQTESLLRSRVCQYQTATPTATPHAHAAVFVCITYAAEESPEEEIPTASSQPSHPKPSKPSRRESGPDMMRPGSCEKEERRIRRRERDIERAVAQSFGEHGHKGAKGSNWLVRLSGTGLRRGQDRLFNRTLSANVPVGDV